MLDNVMEMSAATISPALRDYVLPPQKPFSFYLQVRQRIFILIGLKFLHGTPKVQTGSTRFFLCRTTLKSSCQQVLKNSSCLNEHFCLKPAAGIERKSDKLRDRGSIKYSFIY